MRHLRTTTREHREHMAAAAAILVFNVILFAPLLSGKTFSQVGAQMYSQYPWTAVTPVDPRIVRGYPQTDQADAYYPTSVFATNAIRSGQFPMWLPYNFGGLPALALGLSGWLYPPRLLVMPIMSPIRQHDFLLFTHLLVTALGMYGLLRLWGANLLGAMLGAFVWELNGHNAFWLILEHVAFAATWLPLMLLAATLAIRRQSFKWAVASGGALAMALYTGSLHYVYLNALALAAWYSILVVSAFRKSLPDRTLRSVFLCLSLPVCGVIALLALGAASWLPFMQQVSQVHRKPVPLAAQLREAIPFNEVARALVSPKSLAGAAGKYPDAPSFSYTGVVALILAMAAFVITLTRLTLIRAPVVFAIVICLLSLGFASGFGPEVRILRLVVPFFGTFHPHAGFYLFCFGIGVLAAFGMTEVSRLLANTRLPFQLLFAAGCLVLLTEAVQLLKFQRAITPVQPESAALLFPETALIRTLKGMQGSHHVLPIANNRPGGWWPPVLVCRVAGNFDLRSGTGYESIVPLPTAALWRTVEQGGVPARDFPLSYCPTFYHNRLSFDLLEKISVGLLITPPNVAPHDVQGGDAIKDGTLQLVYSGTDGWIYKVNRALPRAFIAPGVLAAPDPSTSLRTLLDKEFNARETAIVIGEEAARQTGLGTNNVHVQNFNASATIVADRLNDVEIQVTTPQAGMLVLNDSWDSGWKAYVDGIKQPVFRVNYAFRGVVVPEGQHNVAFLYRPTLLFIGLGISGGTLLVLLAFCLRIGFQRFRMYRLSVST